MLEIKFDQFPTLRTKRLFMREQVESDAERFYRLRNLPEVIRYLDREPDADVQAVKDLIGVVRKRFEAGDGIAWAMSLEENGPMIGSMAIWRIDRANHRGEVGYMLSPEYWNQGLMSEAMETVIDFAWNRIGLHSLEANTSVGNEASHALLRKFGFVQEAHFKENWYFRGQFFDSVIFSLLTPHR